MRKPSRDGADLVAERREEARAVATLGVQHLDRDRHALLSVKAAPHLPHAPASKRLDEVKGSETEGADDQIPQTDSRLSDLHKTGKYGHF